MMSKNEVHQAEQLAARKYTTIVFRDLTTDGDAMYVAYNPDLPGCIAQGYTAKEAKKNLNLFRIDYIEHLLAHNIPVPDPRWVGVPLNEDEERIVFSAPSDSVQRTKTPKDKSVVVERETKSEFDTVVQVVLAS